MVNHTKKTWWKVAPDFQEVEQEQQRLSAKPLRHHSWICEENAIPASVQEKQQASLHAAAQRQLANISNQRQRRQEQGRRERPRRSFNALPISYWLCLLSFHRYLLISVCTKATISRQQGVNAFATKTTSIPLIFQPTGRSSISTKPMMTPNKMDRRLRFCLGFLSNEKDDGKVEDFGATADEDGPCERTATAVLLLLLPSLSNSRSNDVINKSESFR